MSIAPATTAHRKRRARAAVLRPIAGLLVLMALGACTSTDDFQDAVAAINPFGENKKKLQGERHPVLDESAATQVAKGKSVAISAPRPIGNWGQAAGPAANNPGNVALNGTGGTRIWATKAGEVGAGDFTRDSVRISARPVSADGRIFVYDPNGNVSAHSADNGTGLWKVNLRPEGIGAIAPGGGVATDGPRVYVSTGYGVVAALDAATGATVWSRKLDKPGRSAPAVADGKLYLGSEGNVLYALNAADGTDVWNFRGVPEVGGLLGASNPAVSGGIVVVPFSSGELDAIDIKTGNGLWSEQMARASRNFAVTGLSDITASPVIDDGVVYATGIGSRTAAFNLKTGLKLWDIGVGSAHTPAVAGNAVFIVDLDDNLLAIDRKSGETVWSSHLPVNRTKHKATHWAGPLLAGGSLWLVSNEGGMLAVDPTSGRVTMTKGDGHELRVTAPIVANGHMVTLSATGTLAAYD
ncbi:MAG: PQQ-binding-like beta-propeller repeat protein [Ancalomicrobiaceae bacterium]|nr:PQQ-binding-like beta-propeller repeat protein [Ancalomicrobiaceae bacterium]